ncbi:hypothetical protein ZIOFF_040349 [Zingiber officinale]|uniref:NAD(P)-binding domain-containing protein n=1 Tax=Zingiber officinale TaxID=94328 RepID=A0A8J5GFB3_ZINOF|nr:hypothetical protein ZIOFF_040349 [Zingiber officinale]
MSSMYGSIESNSPPSSIKILVLGGNGFVGSHVCKEALARGFSVASLSRSGRPSIKELWADEVEWYKGNLLEPESLKDAMRDATSVISCVGGFGSPSYMRTLNGTANVNAVQAAAENGVKRFVYISAASFGVIDYCIQGYYDGQRATEAEIKKRFADAEYRSSESEWLHLELKAHDSLLATLENAFAGVILRPGYIYGTRPIGPLKIPFGRMWTPFEMAFQHTPFLRKIPLIGPFFTPPVNVAKVAKVTVKINLGFAIGILTNSNVLCLLIVYLEREFGEIVDGDDFMNVYGRSSETEPLKAEEAGRETSRSTAKILVLGGNGFVGSHVCKEALAQGFSVSSLSRSGKPSTRESWAEKVEWHKGNLLEPESLRDAMSDATAVVSCVGGFGSPSHMRTLNGTANVNAVQVASEQGVQRFAYVSAASFGVIDYFLQGYYDGQRVTEAAISSRFPNGGVILRPGYIYGKSESIIFAPFEKVLQYAEPLRRIPLIGPVFTPPVSVFKVAKLLVLGGNGFIGSHVCKEALDQGLSVSSLSRSGRSSIREQWADKVEWRQGSLLVPETWRDALNDVTAVISCVGGFGSNSHMYKINGTANINAIRAASEKGVKRFVYVSAADFGPVNYLLKGYYEGKRDAEAELLLKFAFGGVILRPGFVHGTRRVGSIKIPLWLIGSPLEMVLQHAKPLSRIPVVGPLFTPPVNVTSVAKVAVRAATNPVFPPGIVDAYGILRYGKQK